MKIPGTNWTLTFPRALRRRPSEAATRVGGDDLPTRNRPLGMPTSLPMRPRQALLSSHGNESCDGGAAHLPAYRPSTPLQAHIPAALMLPEVALVPVDHRSAQMRQFESDFVQAGNSGPSSRHAPATTVSYDVPDIRQTRLNACGDACMNTMLAFHGLHHEPFGTNDRRVFQGLRDEQLANSIEARGLQVTFLGPANDGNITQDELGLWLRTYGPLICGSSDHYFVVTGLRQNEVTIHCPLLGRRQGPLEALNRYINWAQEQPPILATTLATEHQSCATVAESSSSAQRRRATQGAATRLLAFIEKRATPDWKKPE